MEKLQKEFSDFTVSTLNDITKTYDNDPEKAAQYLRSLAQEEKHQKEQKINELHKQFSELPRQVVAKILEEHNYNDDAALFPLYEKLNEVKKQKEAEKKKQRELEAKKRRDAEVKQQIQSLMEVFQSIPKETIQRILDENEGDLSETTNQLLVLVADQENQKKQEETHRAQLEDKKRKEEELKSRNLKFEVLKEKFPELSYEEVLKALENTGWDIRLSCKYLVTYSAEKKLAELKVHFSEFSSDEIQTILQNNDWDSAKAVKSLTEIREKRKREDEERKKVEEEALLTINSIKIQQNLLERSIMLGNEIEQTVTKEEEIQKKTREEEARGQFKKELEHILTVQAQNGAMPGLVPPPLPKQIDELVGKKRPEEIDIPVQPHAPVDNKPSPVSVSQERNDTPKGLVVTLKTDQEVVDCGNTITVKWEVASGTSTAYDWIGFYAVDQPNKNYVTYDWRGKQDNKGSLTFTAPSTYGVYEFRYFPSSSYEHVAMSNKVVVGPQIVLKATLDAENKKIKATWNKQSGNDYSSSWIGLFEKSSPDTQFITWEYAGKSGAEILFDAPVKPVEYELRFFAYKYVRVAKSNTVRVDGQDKISATYNNGTVTVKLNIVTVDPKTDNVWVGIFFTDEKDNRKWRRYKYVKDRTADVVFNSPRHEGMYEVRLFANKSFDYTLKSEPIAIPNQL